MRTAARLALETPKILMLSAAIVICGVFCVVEAIALGITGDL